MGKKKDAAEASCKAEPRTLAPGRLGNWAKRWLDNTQLSGPAVKGAQEGSTGNQRDKGGRGRTSNHQGEL